MSNDVTSIVKAHIHGGPEIAALRARLSPDFTPPDPAGAEPIDPSKIEGILVETLRAAVAGRRVAFALSGGVDSTLLAALAVRHGLVDRLVAYSTSTDAGRDLPFARMAANALGAEHRVIPIPHGAAALELHARLTDAAAWMVPLVGNSIGFATLCLAAAEDGFETLVDGSGADQLYAGTYKTHGVCWAAAVLQAGREDIVARFEAHARRHAVLNRADFKAIERLRRGPPIDFAGYLSTQVKRGQLIEWLFQHQASHRLSGISIAMPYLSKGLLGLTALPLEDFFVDGYSKIHLRRILERLVGNDVAWRIDNQGLRWLIRDTIQRRDRSLRARIERSAALPHVDGLTRLRYATRTLPTGKLARLYACAVAMPHIARDDDLPQHNTQRT